MQEFALTFSKYNTYDDHACNPNRGKRVTSQPVFRHFDSFEDAYQYAKTRVEGMRDADPVNTYEIASIEAGGYTGYKGGHVGPMFEIECVDEGEGDEDVRDLEKAS